MERRKQYLIDKKIQISLLKFILILLLVVCGSFSFLLIKINAYLSDYVLVMAEEGGQKQMIPSSEKSVSDLKKLIVEKDAQFQIQIYLAILILALIVSFLTIRYTHRIAGPIYRFKVVLDRAIQGDYSPRINLRKRDHLKELAQKINQLLDSVEKRKS